MDTSFKTNLNEYVSQCKTRLKSVLQVLNWTEEGTLKDYNTNSIASSTRHVLKKCNPVSTTTFPDSCVTNNSVVLDTQQLQNLLENNTSKAPVNFNELQANFTREQKLRIYKHAIDNTRKLENNLIDKEIEGEISLADILAQKKREEKKKKRRFRKSKPTRIEEVRCLVDLQMQALEQFLGNKIKKVEETTSQTSYSQKHYGKDTKYTDERIPPKDYDRREWYREIYKYHRKDSGHRSLKLISPHESSYIRKMEFESRDRERRHRSKSPSEEYHRKRKKHKSKEHHSNEKRKHKRRSKSRSNKTLDVKRKRSYRRSRSYDKELSEERSNSHNSRYARKENGTTEKYSSRRELASHSSHSKEKYNKYYRKHSNSPESYSHRK